MISIVACDLQNGIGRQGQLLHPVSEDLKHFKKLTLGKTVIYGRKTLDTFPGRQPLPGRENWVLSQSLQNQSIPQVKVFNSMDELIEAMDTAVKSGASPDDFCVIGGASVYKQFMPLIHRIILTRLKSQWEADTFFPDPSRNGFVLVQSSEWAMAAKEPLEYRFETWERVPSDTQEEAENKPEIQNEADSHHRDSKKSEANHSASLLLEQKTPFYLLKVNNFNFCVQLTSDQNYVCGLRLLFPGKVIRDQQLCLFLKQWGLIREPHFFNPPSSQKKEQYEQLSFLSTPDSSLHACANPLPDTEDPPIIHQLKEELEAYFSRQSRGFQIPWRLDQGTDFQRRVWKEILDIPYGTTRSYGSIAQALCSEDQNPRHYSRAVGRACGQNPLQLIIPCHRVVSQLGELTGFSGGGVAVKDALLGLEIFHTIPDGEKILFK